MFFFINYSLIGWDKGNRFTGDKIKDLLRQTKVPFNSKWLSILASLNKDEIYGAVCARCAAVQWFKGILKTTGSVFISNL